MRPLGAGRRVGDQASWRGDSELLFNRLFALSGQRERFSRPAADGDARWRWGRSLSHDVSCLIRQANGYVALTHDRFERSPSSRSRRWHRQVRL